MRPSAACNLDLLFPMDTATPPPLQPNNPTNPTMPPDQRDHFHDNELDNVVQPTDTTTGQAVTSMAKEAEKLKKGVERAVERRRGEERAMEKVEVKEEK
ncbi:hypothetical protein M409DRAFT_27619 [Zasmidium cellare ATCC 36951]|uniref:Uncharacterized protein n=1 Tax=Zasmidium cellare ATCC 36951 TaxID=1080233 RepID=A0A6A6C7L6_ZASCE|nr:uncharacterized protein M409DRAFT_27619 [Zasmidium cellare ATCC 36951]KAF2161892.1 hypothetical protein M409DRAFT_27619 [Zasmidium cellare ATCC 36951]